MDPGPLVIASAAARCASQVLDEPLYAHHLRVTGAHRPYRQQLLQEQENDGAKVLASFVEPRDKKASNSSISPNLLSPHFYIPTARATSSGSQGIYRCNGPTSAPHPSRAASTRSASLSSTWESKRLC